jgi:hypothetical protein
MRRLACLLALACPAPALAADPPLRPAGATTPLGNERLSDERTLTRWAHPATLAPVRTRPRTGVRAITRLRARTEDGLPEVYLALRSHVDEQGRAWVQIRLPMRPNGRTGWVTREALADLEVVRTRLVVDRRALKATLYRRGRAIWSSRIGVGAPGTPTPRGAFYVRERLRNLGGGGIYGPWAFGTSAYSVLSDWPGGGVVGIHGTDQPQLIPGRPSHGCVRVPNDRIRRLARLMPVGTPVRIR